MLIYVPTHGNRVPFAIPRAELSNRCLNIITHAQQAISLLAAGRPKRMRKIIHSPIKSAQYVNTRTQGSGRERCSRSRSPLTRILSFRLTTTIAHFPLRKIWKASAHAMLRNTTLPRASRGCHRWRIANSAQGTNQHISTNLDGWRLGGKYQTLSVLNKGKRPLSSAKAGHIQGYAHGWTAQTLHIQLISTYDRLPWSACYLKTSVNLFWALEFSLSPQGTSHPLVPNFQ